MARRESAEEIRARAKRVAAALARLHPDADCALVHASALELLVATILSAQCTDERVNRVTPELFRRYPDAEAYAGAAPAERPVDAGVRAAVAAAGPTWAEFAAWREGRPGGRPSPMANLGGTWAPAGMCMPSTSGRT